MFPFVTSQVDESSRPPKIPEDFPSYVSEDFVTFLEDLSSIKSEICCVFHALSLRSTFDPPGFFDIDPECFQYFRNPSCPEDDEKPGLVLTISNAVVHVINDFLNVKRIGVGTSTLDLLFNVVN